MSDKISPTRLNTYIACPRRWYYRYFLDLPDEKTWPLYLGSALHAVAEHEDEALEYGRAMDIALDSIGEYTPTEPQRQELISLVGRLLTQMAWRREDTRGRKYPTHSETEVPVENDELRGIIDVIGAVGGLAMIEATDRDASHIAEGILDYKTSKLMADARVRDEYRRQLGIYCYLFHEERGFWPDVAVLHFVRDGSRIAYDDTEGIARRAIDDLEKVKPGMNEDAFCEPKRGTWHCRFCAYKRMCDNDSRGGSE